jgi:hypothetical protein
LNVVAGVLNLGNIGFKTPAGNTDGSEVQDRDNPDGPFMKSAKALGVDPAALEKCLCERSIKVEEKLGRNFQILSKGFQSSIFVKIASKITKLVSKSSNFSSKMAKNLRKIGWHRNGHEDESGKDGGYDQRRTG